ncbi:hypothetical protein L3Y34_009715 [Caenorhabditis briggsae]|uniref:Sdz-33 F-box domain-containing protein n=1 Tax=Caenorhabditis briggsae TaxID=6238 RepID=A0AAE9A7U2_CAEBR|nr:hypothetical protein L3Y34_009714 [Caenorhabditis briggsae]ULT92167.1 hypothetical protein L3Y34_009715 [Caenorhabditis briggsae]ULT92168.1 hypothetical protein L3Y34_009715 [Caenorhabditis briggsae]
MRNCVSIELSGSNLTNEDIQKFIDNWKQGRYPNLQWLSVESTKFTDNFSIDGLESLEDTSNICEQRNVPTAFDNIWSGSN